MKYYITTQTHSFSRGILGGGPDLVEHTQVVNEEDLAAHLELIAIQKKTLLRIVKGVEIEFRQGIQLIENETNP